MKYSEDTIDNKNFFKRFSHKSRFVVAKKLLYKYKPLNNISMLDFGCGNGFFIKYLIENKFNFNFSAYDPVDEQINEMNDLFNSSKIDNVKIYDDYDLINDKFDIISCLETLEHFREEDQKNHLLKMRKLLKPDGVIYISIPIEVYLSGFIKIILRVLMGQSQENTSLTNIFKTLFGLKISNPDNFSKNYLTTSEDYLNTHMGFYYFDLINLIKKMGFKVEEIKFSPFPFLKSFLNSQIFIKIK